MTDHTSAKHDQALTLKMLNYNSMVFDQIFGAFMRNDNMQQKQEQEEHQQWLEMQSEIESYNT